MTRDTTLFPEDDNGDVLWQMQEDGDDLTEVHEIEFTLAFPSKQQAEQCALHLLHEEQRVSLHEDDNDEKQSSEWLVVVYIHMEPEYQDIVDLEQWFTKIAEQYQGEYDGWGCMAYVYDEFEDVSDTTQ
jgi:regulator of RNase E activity RraB